MQPDTRTLVLILASAILPALSGASPATRPAALFEPTSNYKPVDLQGWRINVHRSLLADHKSLGEQALHQLEASLSNIVRVVPAPAVAALRQVPLWLEFDNPRTRGACYHPSRQWLLNNGFNPDKAGAIEIGSAARYLDPRHTAHQPWMILHELAHAYHFRVLGGNNPDIQAAYRRALDAGLYSSILIWNGRKGRHYALTNDREFFAELSESYFGFNDFYPFVRAEFREYDPPSVLLIERLWGVGQSATRPTTLPAAAAGAVHGGGAACE